jgi:hypothetical protein
MMANESRSFARPLLRTRTAEALPAQRAVTQPPEFESVPFS